jgi:acetyltransferase
MERIESIFSPESVAVIGASNTPGKVGHDIFANILRGRFTGTLYPVNPATRAVQSVRAYASILDVPDPVELAIIILPPGRALKAVEEAVGKGVHAIVIVSAGFREVGREGLAIENRIIAMCRERGVRVVGPNCLGVINPLPAVRLNASFATRMPAPGNISFISQSGALCTAVLDFAADRDFGFSKFISIGNKADVDELDLLQYLHADPDTEVIMIYLEELRRGAEFIDAVKEITSGYRRTPVIVIKSGRTLAGASAAASHTGSLAGSEAVYDAIFTQSGIIRAESIDQMFDFASAFAYKTDSALGKTRRKVPMGNRVAIITNAGGPGIVATDMTVSSGLRLARFHPDTIDILARHLPETANLNNPIDVIGDAPRDRYEDALSAVIEDEGVDGVLVILTPQSMTDARGTAEVIVRIARTSQKPILCCFMGIVDVSPGVEYLQHHGYPVFRFPERAASAFGALYRHAAWLKREHLPQFTMSCDIARARSVIARCRSAGKLHLGELEGNSILEAYGFHVLPTQLATTAEDAVAAAQSIGYPVVMKIVSEQILHKTDAGGVQIGLENADAVTRAFSRITRDARAFDPQAVIDGVLIQKMAPEGTEVILGMKRYPVFGPLLMFGFGGVFVEVFQDVSFRLAPIGRNEAGRMIRQIKGFKLLSGFRNRPRADIDVLEQAVVRLSALAISHPEIQELDINPLLAHPEGRGATVADCRMLLTPATSKGASPAG